MALITIGYGTSHCKPVVYIMLSADLNDHFNALYSMLEKDPIIKLAAKGNTCMIHSGGNIIINCGGNLHHGSYEGMLLDLFKDLEIRIIYEDIGASNPIPQAPKDVKIETSSKKKNVNGSYSVYICSM